jgi:RNA polymerase sigma-70 factor (ECF subfamily)
MAHALHVLGHRSADTLEDVVQETFLQALNKVGQLREPEAFRGWLHAILRNVCLQHLRRVGRVAIVPLDDSPGEAVAVEVDLSAPSERVREQVWAALDELPSAVQVAMLLRHFGAGRSYDEIAAVLGVPIGTVRSRLHDGRRRLAATLRAAAERDGGGLLRRLEADAAEFGDLLGAVYREGRREWFDLLAEDLVVRFPGREPARGRVHIERDFAGDVEAGVRLDVKEVIASSSICIASANLVSPVEDPFHCPPAATMLTFRDASGYSRLQMYFAPRPPEAAIA